MFTKSRFDNMIYYPGITKRLSIVHITIISVLFAGTSASAETFSARSGKSTRIKGFTSWNANCSYKPVRMDIVKPPKHGKVKPRLETSRIGTILSGSAKCKGRKIKKVMLYYKSKRGYKGRDSFTVRLRFGNGPQRFTYRINVR